MSNKKFFFKKPKMYSVYIFTHFAVSFFTWFLIFFIVLFAIKQMDFNENYSFNQNLIFSFIKTFNKSVDNSNIILLIGCIFFIKKQLKNFNFYILQTFGLTSWQILKPMLTFVVLFGILKTFCLQPTSVKLENYLTIFLKKTNVNNIRLKKGTNFIIIDEKNTNNYSVINGSYNFHDKKMLNFSNATILQYNNKKLTTIYTATSATVQDYVITMKNVNVTNINIYNPTQKSYKNKQFSIGLKKEEMIFKIKNENKLKKSILTNIFDHIKTLSQHNGSMAKNEQEIQAKTAVSNNIIDFFNSILCCFLVLLFCLVKRGRKSFEKNALLCFIVYFIILRIFYSLEYIIKLSTYSSLCVIYISFLLCLFFYLLIINRDWCDYYLNSIKKILKKVIQFKN